MLRRAATLLPGGPSLLPGNGKPHLGGAASGFGEGMFPLREATPGLQAAVAGLGLGAGVLAPRPGNWRDRSSAITAAPGTLLRAAPFTAW